MTEEKARIALRDACARLVREGLVARTWGNLSIRVGDRFLITPSGRQYETLGAEEMVSVSLDDLSWEGSIKPSSEKNLHAALYRLDSRRGAVIHTHQPAASSLAVAGRDVPVDDERFRALLGPLLPCVGYALPTTRRLAERARRRFAASGAQAALLTNHGAICCGGSIDEALARCSALEEFAAVYVLSRFSEMSGRPARREEMIDWWLERKTGGKQ